MSQPNILIASPTYGGLTEETRNSLEIALTYLTAKGIPAKRIDMNINPVDVARNAFASFLVQEKSFTHVLFVDNDCDFEPRLIERTIKADKLLIGVVCPRREIDLNKLCAAARVMNDEAAIATTSRFVLVNDQDIEALRAGNGIAEITGIGMAFTLIKREAFEQMIATGKVRTQDDHEFGRIGLNGPIYGFFDQIVIGDRALPEDWSFCERWQRLCNGETWGIADEKIGHVGKFVFRAALMDRFKR